MVLNADFTISNRWTLDSNGEKWPFGERCGQPMYLIDNTTGRRYLNESKTIVRIKCFLLTLGTPLAHPFVSIINIAYRILKLISLSHFWIEKKNEEKKYNFKARSADAGYDLLRIFATPVSIVCLELAALYGCFRPYDGRKLYASLERATYGNYILAPCFQPDPKRHLFGGDIRSSDGF